MPDQRLTRQQRLDILAELCPRFGTRRPCDSYELAQTAAVKLLGPSSRARITADYVLMRAVDRFAAGQLSLEDLYRCRVLAYYMTFATGGEEWERWGVVARVTPGDFAPLLDDTDLDELPPPIPEGPPWRETR